MVLDADTIIRYITDDDFSKAERFEKFLKSNKRAYLTDVTFSEIFYVLKSFYKFPVVKIVESLIALLNQSNIISNRIVLLDALNFVTKYNVSFADGYVATFSIIKDDKKVISYDKGFDKISEIKRKEP